LSGFGERRHDLIEGVGDRFQDLADTLAFSNKVGEQTSNALFEIVAPHTQVRKEEPQSRRIVQQRLVSSGVDGHVGKHLQHVLEHLLGQRTASVLCERREEALGNSCLDEIRDGSVLARAHGDQDKHPEGGAHVVATAIHTLNEGRSHARRLHEMDTVLGDHSQAPELLQPFKPLGLNVRASERHPGRHRVEVGTLVDNHPTALTHLLLLRTHCPTQLL